MRAIVRNRNFVFLWIGGLISATGSMVLTIALPYYVYARTGSVLATSALLIAERVPSVVFGSIAGVFVDRWDRRRTMIVADVSRAALLLALLAIRARGDLWIIYVVACVEAAITVFFAPAASAVIPLLVGEEHLTTANALSAISQNLSLVVGSSLGGALLGLVGLPTVVLVDSVSYLISGILIASMAPPGHALVPPREQEALEDPEAELTDAWLRVWHEWRDGLRVVRRERVLTLLFVLFGVVLFVDGIINVVYVPFARGVLRATAVQFGWLATAQGMGALLGSLAIGLLGRTASPIRVMVLGLLVAGGLFLVEANVPVLPVILPLVFVTAGPIVGINVGGTVLLQRAVEDRYRGRVFGAFGTTLSLAMLIGMGVGSALGESAGVVAAFDLGGFLYLAAGLLTIVLLRGEVAAGISSNGRSPTKQTEPTERQGVARGEEI